jgi:crotonobetainyl-CoA:carnitine CoA-transferase CaiB-like acyl-CoA transferase
VPEEQRFATNSQRIAQYNELRPILAAYLRTQPRSHWITRLTEVGVPCGSVRDLPALFADPQIAARTMVAEVEHQSAGAIRVLGTPIKLSDTPAEIRTAPPVLGQHTAAILSGELGVTSEELGSLRAKGVV